MPLLAVVALSATILVSGSALAAGKPGYPDRVTWSGGSWQIKTSNAAVGPGPNIFSKANVSVDGSGFLHLKITKDTSGRWTTSEVIAPTSLGYGTYTFTGLGRVPLSARHYPDALARLAPNVAAASSKS